MKFPIYVYDPLNQRSMWYWPAKSSIDAPYRTYFHDGNSLDPDQFDLTDDVEGEPTEVSQKREGGKPVKQRIERGEREEIVISSEMLAQLDMLQEQFRQKYPQYYRQWEGYDYFLKKYNKSKTSSADQGFINYHLQRGFSKSEIIERLCIVNPRAAEKGQGYLSLTFGKSIKRVVSESFYAEHNNVALKEQQRVIVDKGAEINVNIDVKPTRLSMKQEAAIKLQQEQAAAKDFIPRILQLSGAK